MIFPALGTKETKLYWDNQIEQKVMFWGKKKKKLVWLILSIEVKENYTTQIIFRKSQWNRMRFADGGRLEYLMRFFSMSFC